MQRISRLSKVFGLIDKHQNKSSSAALIVLARSPHSFYTGALRSLSSLRLAILEILSLGALSAVGTFIDQGRSVEFYKEMFPEGEQQLYGFLTWDVILALGLNNVYNNPLYYLNIIALGISLLACTTTRQWPILKTSKRLELPTVKERVLIQPKHESLSRAKLSDLGRLLDRRKYQVFVQNDSMYAYKGLTGRYAPILVHAALIMTLIGFAIYGGGGWSGSVIVPKRGDFLVLNHIYPFTRGGILPAGSDTVVHINDFTIDYLENGQVDQFYSDLSVFDLNANELIHEKIFVNKPLRFGGITIYQADWSMAAIVLSVHGNPLLEPDTAISLPLASLEGQPGFSGASWGSFIPVQASRKHSSKPSGVSVVARDFQSVAVYDSDGKFVAIRKIGSKKPVKVDGMELRILEIVGSTGLEVKADPSLPIVYTGFGLLLVTSFLSSISFSQIWAVQDGSTVHIGGKNNRLPLQFDLEMESILRDVPDYVKASSQTTHM